MKTEIPPSLAPAFERQAHPYQMWDGIQAIPAGILDALSSQEERSVQSVAEIIRRQLPISVIGCGTSFFAAQAIASAIRQVAGLPATAWEAFEYLEYPPPGSEAGTLIGISHTGGTPSVVRAVEKARGSGAFTLAFSDAPGSALDRAAEVAFGSRLGLEPALPKTRSYAAALARGYRLAVALAQMNGRPIERWRAALGRAPQQARQILAEGESQVRELAERWQACRRVVVAGGGPQHATAQEAALKLTETVLLPANSWEIEEAAHGAWASMAEGDLLILLAMDGPSYPGALRLAEGMKAIGCQVWVVTNRPWAGVSVDALTLLPGGDAEALMPLYAILPIYPFTYFMALARGLSPDNMGLADPRQMDARMRMRTSMK